MPITAIIAKKIRQLSMRYNREKITVMYIRYKATVTKNNDVYNTIIVTSNIKAIYNVLIKY